MQIAADKFVLFLWTCTVQT